MNRTWRNVRFASVVVLTTIAAPCAWAQPTIDVFAPLDLPAAQKLANQQKRLLVVYLRGLPQPAFSKLGLGVVTKAGDAFEAMDARTWQNPTLAAWLAQHAVTIQIGLNENPQYFQSLARQFHDFGDTNADPTIYPHVGIYRDGVLVAVIPRAGYENERGWTDGGMAPIEAWRMFPKPVGVLIELDNALNLARARDPVWAMDHERLNPPLPPPDWELFYNSAEPNAAAVGDLPAGSDLIARVDDARQASAAGDLHGAAGLYTWIWERMDALDPVYRPARAAVFTDEIIALTRQRPAMRERLKRMRSTIEDRYLWWDAQTWLEYILINDCLDDQAAVFATLGRIAGDVDEDALSTPEEQQIHDVLTSRTWTGLTPPDAGHLAWLASQPALIRKLPKDSDLGILRSRLFFDDSCRCYAALLKAGRETEARTVASSLLASTSELVSRDEIETGLYDPAGARRALVATALLAGEVRPEHMNWLREASTLGQADANLARRVQRALSASSSGAPPREHDPGPVRP